MMGIALPVSPETVIETVLDTPIQKAADAEKSKLYFKMAQRYIHIAKNESAPMTSPERKAILISENIIRGRVFSSRRSPRRVTASDFVPALPAIPSRSG